MSNLNRIYYICVCVCVCVCTRAKDRINERYRVEGGCVRGFEGVRVPAARVSDERRTRARGEGGATGEVQNTRVV